MLFAGSVTLSDACCRMKDTMGSSATDGQVGYLPGGYLQPLKLMCQKSSSGCNADMLRRSPPDAMWS